MIEFINNKKQEINLNFLKLVDHKEIFFKISDSEVKSLFIQNICLMIKKTLPLNVIHENIFNFISYVFKNISLIDDSACLPLLSYFEFILLKETGFGLSTKKCCFCSTEKNLHIIFIKNGHSACINCEKINYNRFVLYPKLWNEINMNGEMADIVDKIIHNNIHNISESLNVTWIFLKKNIDGLEESPLRSRFLSVGQRFSMRQAI